MQAAQPTAYLPIGEVARRTGIAVSAIRYYEQAGLVGAATRSEGRHRLYPEAEVDALRLVRQCRDLGFGVAQTRALLGLADNPDEDCTGARDIAYRQLTAVKAKMAELRLLQQSLMRYVQSCDAQCVGGPAPRCCIFEKLRTAAGDGQATGAQQCSPR